jgi:hypothetical protein
VAGHTGVGVLLVWLWRRSNSYILICVSARPLAWAVCARLHTHARPYSLLRYLRENAKVLTIHTHTTITSSVLQRDIAHYTLCIALYAKQNVHAAHSARPRINVARLLIFARVWWPRQCYRPAQSTLYPSLIIRLLCNSFYSSFLPPAPTSSDNPFGCQTTNSWAVRVFCRLTRRLTRTLLIIVSTECGLIWRSMSKRKWDEEKNDGWLLFLQVRVRGSIDNHLTVQCTGHATLVTFGNFTFF